MKLAVYHQRFSFHWYPLYTFSSPSFTPNVPSHLLAQDWVCIFLPSTPKEILFQDDRPGPCKSERTHVWENIDKGQLSAGIVGAEISEFVLFLTLPFHPTVQLKTIILFKLTQLPIFQGYFYTENFMRHLFLGGVEKLMVSQSNCGREHETNRFAFWCSDLVLLLMLGLNFPNFSILDPV